MKVIRAFLLVVGLICITNRNLLGMGMEDFGPAAKVNKLDYTDWPGIPPLLTHASRVYHSWVNGNEHLFYKGDTAALNDAMVKFVAIDAKKHEIVLQPGPGIGKSFIVTNEANTPVNIPMNWSLHVVGGIVGYQSTLDKGELVLSRSPIMTVYVGGSIDLQKIQIPKGVTVLQLDDLAKRYSEAQGSKDSGIRDTAIRMLAEMNTPPANEAEHRQTLKSIEEFVKTAGK